MKFRFALLLLICSFPLIAAPKSSTKADETELFTAVETASLKQIRKLLNKSIKLPIRENNETLLMAAVKADRDIDVIKELIDADEDVTRTTDDGVTALMYACQYETHEKVITFLITNSAMLKSGKQKYVLATDSNGKTAFDYAEKNQTPLAIRKLLEKYAKIASAPQTTAAQSVTPTVATAVGESLLMSTLKLNADITRVYDVLNAGEDVSQASPSGATALMYACQYETHDNVIITIIERTAALKSQKKSFVLATDNEGKTAFDYALLNKNPQHVIDLLERYIENPNPVVYISTATAVKLEQEAEHKAQERALAMASAPEPAEAEESVQKELNALPPSDVTVAVDPFTPTYLFDYAELESEGEITEPDSFSEGRFRHTFISNADERDSEGRTLLMKAIRDGNDELIDDLLYSEADIQAQDNDGWTTLMFAARFQSDATYTKRLLSLGADATKKNNYGLTALALAAGLSDSPEVVSTLLENRTAAEKDVRASFIYAVTMEAATDILALFLERGISVNAPYNTKTPLMYAAENNTSTATIAWLLKHGAKTTYKTINGKTAFDFAQGNPRLPHNEAYWALNAANGGN